MEPNEIRTCPFCDYNEGWIRQIEDEFFVECKVCKGKGPSSDNDTDAISYWNGKFDTDFDRDNVSEDAMGGVSTPMATLNNTPGIGNAVPATQAATTGAQFTSDSVKGSGDKFDNVESKTKSKKKKSKKGPYKIATFDDFVKTTTK
jgi:hypothetical protein